MVSFLSHRLVTLKWLLSKPKSKRLIMNFFRIMKGCYHVSRMHSSGMRTVRPQWSSHLPRMPPAKNASLCHTRPLCHACPLSCMPPWPHTAPAMQASHYTCYPTTNTPTMPPSLTEFLTHTGENITFPQILLRTVKAIKITRLSIIIHTHRLEKHSVLSVHSVWLVVYFWFIYSSLKLFTFRYSDNNKQRNVYLLSI